MRIIILFIIAGFFLGCSEGVNTRKHKEIDSLFLGFYFGMPKQEFFDLCWDMNRKKMFTHGPTNQSVEYKLKELEDDVIMNFYPTFHDEKIYEMPVTFTYEAWAPWNRQFWADSLLPKMVHVFEKWYGDGFQSVQHKTMGTVYYKMDGHRRINLFIRDDQFVQAVFTDMRIRTKLKQTSQTK